MTGQTKLTRRQFIETGLATAAVSACWSYTPGALAQLVTPATTPEPLAPADKRVLVAIHLAGGNDGLNTIVPFADKAYYYARPTLGIAQRHVQPIRNNDKLGLHPELRLLTEMMDEGIASVVMGVGYPRSSRSHLTGKAIWERGIPDPSKQGDNTGWLGRAMDRLRETQSRPEDTLSCVAVGQTAPLALQGRSVRPMVFNDPVQYQWSGAELDEALGAMYDRLNQTGILEHVQSVGEVDLNTFVLQTAADVVAHTQRLRAAASEEPTHPFAGGRLADSLRLVASMIRSKQLPVQVYHVTLDGFDTHSRQLEPHAQALWQFIVGINSFYAELAATGLQDRVLTIAYSEFGRRVEENASRGTDHGAAGPMFLFGPMVRPGLIGNHPSLANLDDGDLAHTIDFRSVYAAILDEWLQIDSYAVLGESFKPARVLAARTGR